MGLTKGMQRKELYYKNALKKECIRKIFTKGMHRELLYNRNAFLLYECIRKSFFSAFLKGFSINMLSCSSEVLLSYVLGSISFLVLLGYFVLMLWNQ